MTVEIEARGPGRTELVLTHEGLPDETAAGRHRSGWGDILEKLGASFERGRGA